MLPLFSESSSAKITENYKASMNLLFSNSAYDVLFGDLESLENLSDLEIARLSKSELRLLRNTVYAKYGHVFNSADLTEHFSRFEWYTPKSKVTDSKLTKEELNLVQRIAAFEAMDENAKPVDVGSNLIGIWQDMPYVASGFSDSFVFYGGNELHFLFNEMTQLRIAREYVGTYEIKGNMLVFSVNSVVYNMPTANLEDGAGRLYFANVEKNTATFEKPIVLRFPLSNLENINVSPEGRAPYYKDTFSIGTKKYFKCGD